MAGIHVIAKAAGIKPQQAASLFAAILSNAADGGRVFIKDFGSFHAVKRAARTIHSPQIPGGTAEVPERVVLRFRASPVTKNVLNGAKKKPAAKKQAK